MKKRLAVLSAVLSFSAAAIVTFWSVPGWAQPKAIHVPEGFTTIQAALDSAAAGDTILVSPGIYTENINFRGKNIVLKSVAGPRSTIIDGKQQGSVVTFAAGEDATACLEGFTLRHGSGTVTADGKIYGGAIHCFSSSPTIRRNVMRENVVTAACGALGGGIAILGSSAPLVESNHIYDNSVISMCDAIVNFGGGIFVAGSSTPSLYENTITRNSADFGGGVAVMDTARPLIQRNTIVRNFRSGILVTQLAQPVIGGAPRTGNDIAENEGFELERRLHDAGQIEKINARFNYYGACPPTEDEIFPLSEFDTSDCRRFAVRNYFPLQKGNAWTFDGPVAMTETITDTFTLGKRYLFYRFNEFWNRKDIALRLTEENRLAYRFDPMSVIEHTWVDFSAEIGEQWTLALGEEKWMVELQSKTDTVTVPAGTFTECYRFFFDWGCCDNSWIEWYAPGVGPVKRVLLGFAVIEYPLLRAFIHGQPVSVNDRSGSARPAQFMLHQNYPNPLLPARMRAGTETVIRYELPQTAFVLLEIFNLLGQKVRTLVAASQPLGRYEVLWSGRDDAGKALPSGVYFYRLDAGNFTQVRKLALLK
ncbi:right-handed parallel beta-helix repeat-containing protein [bacterium]|nr:right-handed parallel beta-helix repeat-containing protein [bacterium]